MKLNLNTKKCIACEDGMKSLTKKSIIHHFSELKNKWELVDDKKIQYVFQFKNFKDAMRFVNKVADLAESEGHHPNIHIYYNKVVIELTTHSIRGLSANDFILAVKIEKLNLI